MAKAPTKKAAAKAAPSTTKTKEKTVRAGKVTFGKGVTLGRGVK